MAVSGVISLSIQPRFTSVQVNLKRNEILFISSRLIGDTFLYQADIVILCVYLILQLWRTSSETRPLQISVLNCILLFVETAALTLKRRERHWFSEIPGSSLPRSRPPLGACPVACSGHALPRHVGHWELLYPDALASCGRGTGPIKAGKRRLSVHVSRVLGGSRFGCSSLCPAI